VFLLVRITESGSFSEWLRVVVYEIVEGILVGDRVFEDDPGRRDDVPIIGRR